MRAATTRVHLRDRARPPLESDLMIQILISLAILALWALTSLLSRDSQPLPPRPARARGPDGQRPAPAFARNDQGPANPSRPTGDRAGGVLSDSRLGTRPLDPTQTAGRAPRRVLPLSDDVRILDSDLRLARGNAGQPAASSSGVARGARKEPRRSSRGRSSTSPSPAKPAEAVRLRALTSQVNQSMARAMGRPFEGTQLEAPLAALSSTSLTPLANKSAASEQDAEALPPGQATDVAAVRAMLASPKRLREVAILSELLKPPLGLRRRGRFR
jgi:hypothetical protein